LGNPGPYLLPRFANQVACDVEQGGATVVQPGASRALDGTLTAKLCAPLVIILVLGALVRLALLAWFADVPLSIWDERDYNAIAVNLVEHGEFAFDSGSPTSLRPPLYPAMVAGVYWLFGLENYQAVRLLQVGLSLLNVLLLYRLGAAISSRRVGSWLAGMFCFYPSLLVFDNLLLTETLFTLLLSAACYGLVLFYQREHFAYLLATGVLLGLAALTRSVVWMSFPFLSLYLLLTWKAPWRRRLLAPVAVCVAFAATLAPWSIRNSRLEGTFVAVDTMGGRNFMMGNYRHTPLYRSWDAIAITGDQAWHHEVHAAYPAEARDTQGKVDKLALRQGLKFVRENPWLTLERDVIKFFDFWGLERELVSGAGNGFFGPVPQPVVLLLALVIFGSFAGVMVLGIFGALTVPVSDRRIHWLLLLVIAYICGMHTLVFGHSRYHLPIMPLVLLFTASAVVNARQVWDQRRSWTFRLGVALCCVLLAGWLWGVVAGDLDRFLSLVGATG
jgi:4-amino-4-deoxy-L-arabinose transferase-like glycosyltransferase